MFLHLFFFLLQQYKSAKCPHSCIKYHIIIYLYTRIKLIQWHDTCIYQVYIYSINNIIRLRKYYNRFHVTTINYSKPIACLLGSFLFFIFRRFFPAAYVGIDFFFFYIYIRVPFVYTLKPACKWRNFFFFLSLNAERTLKIIFNRRNIMYIMYSVDLIVSISLYYYVIYNVYSHGWMKNVEYWRIYYFRYYVVGTLRSQYPSYEHNHINRTGV